MPALRVAVAARLLAAGPGIALRAFHNAGLDDGALPLTVLETRIDQWIASRKEKS